MILHKSGNLVPCVQKAIAISTDRNLKHLLHLTNFVRHVKGFIKRSFFFRTQLLHNRSLNHRWFHSFFPLPLPPLFPTMDDRRAASPPPQQQQHQHYGAIEQQQQQQPENSDQRVHISRADSNDDDDKATMGTSNSDPTACTAAASSSAQLRSRKHKGRHHESDNDDDAASIDSREMTLKDRQEVGMRVIGGVYSNLIYTPCIANEQTASFWVAHLEACTV